MVAVLLEREKVELYGWDIHFKKTDFSVIRGTAAYFYLYLVRFGWRDYDPTTARWTAPDPMGDAGGDKDWYGYCLDDPVNAVDPLGLAYSGNDFGPGYDGTSGSAYGPLTLPTEQKGRQRRPAVTFLIKFNW